jgi:surfactin synthase thioesterase subunit
MLGVESLDDNATADAVVRAKRDLISCLSYKHVESHALPVPITTFEGLLDHTTEPGLISLWSELTSTSFRNVSISGGHDFLLTNHHEVTMICTVSTS